MSITTSQQISDYFHDFSDAEVTFTREVVRATGLDPRGVHVRCRGDQWPCAIYGSSMTTARIIAKLHPGLNETLRRADNALSLRYSFTDPDKGRPISFFVKARTEGFSAFGKERPELYLANLTFTQRPPDDLIRILGRLQDANRNAARRREWRLPMSAAIVKLLGILPDRISIMENGSRRRALLRDISFSGCKAVIGAPAPELASREINVVLPFQDPSETVAMAGTVCHADSVEGHDNLGVFGIHYAEEHVPVSYKVRINTALRSQRNESD